MIKLIPGPLSAQWCFITPTFVFVFQILPKACPYFDSFGRVGVTTSGRVKKKKGKGKKGIEGKEQISKRCLNTLKCG